ncbi:MAG: type II secretory ATPase GspE/PulE/Tfp pilus assembly ATPase PilB-like protein [Nitrospinales bacterium]|jgi:type II secretory ATPase GspE/PulE/Tfp pilus assembly ATPase PilB-like protein/GAF domain-containing protein
MGLFSKTKKVDSLDGNGGNAEESHSGDPIPEIVSSSDDSVPNARRRDTDSKQTQIDARGRRSNDRSRPVINKIVSGESMGKILFSLTEELKDLFECQAVTVFAVDREKRQIFSRNFQDDIFDEIRLEISSKSLAGFVAATGKTLNIKNAYDNEEVKKFHSDLELDKSWDEKFEFETRSALVVALPYNKRLMGVIECINHVSGNGFNDGHIRQAKDLSSTLGHALVKLEVEDLEAKIQDTAHAIHSAGTIDEILLELQQPILQLFDAGLITIYAVDEIRNEIYSKSKSGSQVNEIRVPISEKSISGCVAQIKKPFNINDVYNADELKNFHPDLKFDSSWDKKTGLRTKSMLVYPLIQGENLMGVVQLVNKKHGEKFTSFDERNAKIIAQTLALAFFNQQKINRQKRTKFGYLVESGIISQEELNNATSKARKNQMDIETVLLGDLKLKRKDLGKALELYYSLPYQGFNDSIVLPQSNFSGLNKNYLSKNHWVPMQNDEDCTVILTDDPANKDRIQNIQMIFSKKKLELKVGLKIDIREYLLSAMTEDEARSSTVEEVRTEEMSSLLDALEGESAEVVETTQEDSEVNAISETDSTIVRLVNKVLTDAYDQGVSDIHIEPGTGKKPVKVRFRKDGTCRVYQEIPYLYKQAMISRIKIMSKLDIAERRMPQDGKIKMKYGRKDIEYRVATCPTVGGNEDAVLRILAASKPIPLEGMNFSERNIALVKDKSTKPYGLILVVGPTGSGKTTTLHSCLGFINKPETKIWTAEDPVEITQDGLRQVQMLNKIGLDFARAMKSFLRGDPDVIMVGEMRDAETCSIGLEASLTGHLVFSTLHTNSAPETITRLIDMGMNPLNFADALLLIVAQRLVRTLCKTCKEDYHPDRDEFDKLVKEYGEEKFLNLGIEYTDDLMLKKPVGCAACNETGYAGRTGLHELLDGSDDIKRMIMKNELVENLREQAIKDGMTTLKQDGIYKIFKGDCDLKQVLAVCIV